MPSRDESRIINASEIGTFLFCHRAWGFQQEGAASDREPERQRGTTHHVWHGEAVAKAEVRKRQSRLLLWIAVALALVALFLLVRG